MPMFDNEMIKRARVKPSKEVSALGVVFGIVFTCVGLFFVIPNLSKEGGSVWIGVLWTLGAIGITIFFVLNAFTARGVSIEEVQFEYGSFNQSTSQRLAELEKIKSQGLISDEEYGTKRNEIISKL